MSGLVVSALSVHIGTLAIIKNVSLTARPGALTGLIGPNGAGKSTLMQAILGLSPVATGTVHFNDADLLAMPRTDRARLAAFVQQSVGTDARITAHDVVMLGRIPFQSVWQSAPSPQDDAAVAAALDAVDMAAFSTRLYHTLSGGEQQRIQLARALAQQPRLLLLDEPTSHLDINAQLATLSLLSARARAGATVLVALHDLNLAATFCDELIVLHHGEQVACGPPEAVLTPPILQSVYQVKATLLRHPDTGRPLIAYDPSN